VASFPNRRVDVTPIPKYGAASVAGNSSKGAPANAEQASSFDLKEPMDSGPQQVKIAPGARPWRARYRPGLSSPHGTGPSDGDLAADRIRIRFALLLTFAVLIVVWGVFLIDEQFQLGLNRFGNRPLRWNGTIGILSMPFLHGGWEHIWGNTVSFFTLSSMLVYFYRGTGIKVLGWSWLGSGVLLWMSGASGNHIGLSGVIYALAAFLFLSGIVRRQAALMRVALVVVFLYGSIVWGVLPIEVGVSWQGHLAGACTGLFLALTLRKEGPQEPPIDEEESEEDALLFPIEEANTEPNAGLEPNPSGPAGERRQDLMWKGIRPVAFKSKPLSQRGMRKPRQGAHLKSKGNRDSNF